MSTYQLIFTDKNISEAKFDNVCLAETCDGLGGLQDHGGGYVFRPTRQSHDTG